MIGLGRGVTTGGETVRVVGWSMRRETSVVWSKLLSLYRKGRVKKVTPRRRRGGRLEREFEGGQDPVRGV